MSTSSFDEIQHEDGGSDSNVYDLIESSINSIIGADDGSLVTKWAVVLEAVSPDNPNPSLRIVSNMNTRPWDMVGMLTYARMQLESQSIGSALFGGEEEDDGEF